MKPVLKYPGAKWKLAEWIISYMPKHTTYLEPFFGSGAVFFNKLPSKVETINDIDGNVVNLFRVIRERPDELAALIEMTPWARDELKNCQPLAECDLENARRFIVRCWQTYGSGPARSKSWKDDVTTGQQGLAKTWASVPKRILTLADRLKMALIENMPAIEIVRRYHSKTVLIYGDPPYPRGTRNGRMYAHEMTDADHIELLDALDAHPGPVILSGYACELYDSRLKLWRRETHKAQAEKGQIREEVLWMKNIELQGQMSLEREVN